MWIRRGIREKLGNYERRHEPFRRFFSRSDLPFVLIVLLGDSHAMPGCLVHIVVRLYPHFTRQCAKTLQASAQEKWNAIKRPINR